MKILNKRIYENLFIQTYFFFVLFYLLMTLYVLCNNSIMMGDSNQGNDKSKGII